jgi:hypothetical protein
MQPLSSFNSNLSTAIALTGGAGAGKTSLALRLFPKTYVFVADLNFKSGLDFLEQGQEKGNVIGFDTASPDENGQIVAPLNRYKRMLDKVGAALKDPQVDCVVLDSATFIEDILKAKIVNAQTDAAVRLEGFKQWGDLVLLWKSLIMDLRQSGKKSIMTFHENKEKDESDQIFKYQLAVDGSIRGKIPAYFSDVWRCEVAENMGKHTWQVRTLSNARQEHLKNTFGFPGVITADELVKKVKERK